MVGLSPSSERWKISAMSFFAAFDFFAGRFRSSSSLSAGPPAGLADRFDAAGTLREGMKE